jgi:hypothetical protein
MRIRLAFLLCGGLFGLRAQIPVEEFIAQDPVVRRAAFRQLATSPPDKRLAYLPELGELLHSDQGFRSVLAFAKIGPAARPMLTAMLDDANLNTRAAAAKAITLIPPVEPKTIEKLRQMMQDQSFGVRWSAASCLLSIGVDGEERNSLVHFLGGSGAKPDAAESIPTLIEALTKSDDPDERAEAGQQLMDMGLSRPDVEAAFISVLKGPSARLRLTAGAYLGVFRVTESSLEAQLDDEITKLERKKESEQNIRAFRVRGHSREEILTDIPPDADHKNPLRADQVLEQPAPDGSTVLVTVYSGEGWGDLLRVWRGRGNLFYLTSERSIDEPGTSSYKVSLFRFKERIYLHVMLDISGHGHLHEDEFFRIDAGALTQLSTPKGLPLELAEGEQVLKGAFESFNNDDLRFEFGIWKAGDPNCCPTAGWVSGTYTIVGSELRYATWKRSMDIPR